MIGLLIAGVSLFGVACGPAADEPPGGDQPAGEAAGGTAEAPAAAAAGCGLNETVTLEAQATWAVPCSDPAVELQSRGATADGVGGIEAVLTFDAPGPDTGSRSECRVGTEAPSMSVPINATEELAVEMLNEAAEEGTLRLSVQTRPRTADTATCPVI